LNLDFNVCDSVMPTLCSSCILESRCQRLRFGDAEFVLFKYSWISISAFAIQWCPTRAFHFILIYSWISMSAFAIQWCPARAFHVFVNSDFIVCD